MTTKSESHTRTLPFAKYAIEQIERFGLPAEPKSFELWYRYATGHDSLLNQAVNDAISSPAGLTEPDFDRLCASHGSSERTGSRLSAAATDLSGEITQVIGMIVAAAVSSKNMIGTSATALLVSNKQRATKRSSPWWKPLSSPPEKWKARPERSKCSWRNRKRGPPVCSTK